MCMCVLHSKCLYCVFILPVKEPVKDHTVSIFFCKVSGCPAVANYLPGSLLLKCSSKYQDEISVRQIMDCRAYKNNINCWACRHVDLCSQSFKQFFVGKQIVKIMILENFSLSLGEMKYFHSLYSPDDEFKFNDLFRYHTYKKCFLKRCDAEKNF